MYKDDLYIGLNDLSFDMWATEQGKQIRYLFQMDKDRVNATLVSKQYEYVEGEFKCVGSVGEHVTKECCNDAWRSDVLIWALRGMWGVPLRYGSKETQGVA